MVDEGANFGVMPCAEGTIAPVRGGNSFSGKEAAEDTLTREGDV